MERCSTLRVSCNPASAPATQTYDADFNRVYIITYGLGFCESINHDGTQAANNQFSQILRLLDGVSRNVPSNVCSNV